MTSAEPAAAARLEGDELRAHLFLHGMLPLCDVALRHTPLLARATGAWTSLAPRAAHTQWRTPTSCVGVRVAGGRVEAGAETPSAGVPALAFADAAQVCALFAGAPPLAIARQLVRHPLAFAPVLACLARLRVLADPSAARTAAQRALHVDAALCLIALGLSQLVRAGHPGACGVARSGALRVYQWSVAGSDLASYWRVQAGRTRAGRGLYAREPAFVHVRFASIDAAFRSLSARGSQMERLRSGDVETTGSPEYARRVTELLWDLDELLLARRRR